jgi:hypothetical protein
MEIQHFDADRPFTIDEVFHIGHAYWRVIGWEKRPNLMYRISVERV